MSATGQRDERHPRRGDLAGGEIDAFSVKGIVFGRIRVGAGFFQSEVYVNRDHGEIDYRADDADHGRGGQRSAEIVGGGNVVRLDASGEERAAGYHRSIGNGGENVPGHVALRKRTFARGSRTKMMTKPLTPPSVSRQ